MAGQRLEPPEKYRIAYSEKTPPVAALAAAQMAQISVDAQADPKMASTTQPLIYLANKQQLAGKTAILRFLARVASDSQLAGSSVVASVEVDHWIDYSVGLVSGTGLEAACARVNDYLALRTFLAGHTLSAADLACWAQLSATLQWDGLKKSGKFPHLARWYEHVSSIPEIKALGEQYYPRRRAPAAREAKAAQHGSAKKAGGNSDASFDIGLGPEWEGRVVTRFPPEPSGYLHVGHAKALILNQQIAAANRGRMRIRFDDTNPDKEKDEFVDSILEDAKRLGADISQVTYTSNYFDKMLDLGERLIRAGHLYADDTPQEKMKEERLAKLASRRRDRPVEENLRVWKEMIAGTKEGFLNCMRFKMDPANNNGALRDPVAYRCNDTPHLHTGTTYKVYPTYDCACPFVDALEGVTHALRTSEYRDREEQFYRILKMQQQVWPGLQNVAVWDYSRLSFVNTVLSKRKLTRLVAIGASEGWDDPRMPTVQGLLRRGLTVPALREFILAQGASKNVTYQEWDKIWSINKKVIDPVCPRHTAVKAQAKVLLTLTDVSATDYVTVDRHNKNPGAGKKVTERSPRIWMDQEDAALLKEGEEVTLMEWGNAIVKVTRKNAAGEVTAMEGQTNLRGSVSSTKWKLTWLADSAELVPLLLVDFDHLINKKKLEEDDEIEDLVTLCSRWETEALGDANMRTLQKGDVVQLMRKGYFIVDLPFIRPGKPMVLLSIPDGKAKTPVKPEAAVRAATAAREAAKAAAAAAAKSSASAAALKPKGKPADANGGGAKGKKATAPAERRKAAVEGEEAPISSKVAVQLREDASASSLRGAQARQAGGQEPSDSTSPSAATRPIPVPNRPHSDQVPPTPANTPQAGNLLRAQGRAVQARGENPPQLTREVPATPTNTPATSEELSRSKLPSMPRRPL